MPLPQQTWAQSATQTPAGSGDSAEEVLAAIKVLREKYKDTERKGWLVLGSNSWIKGTDAAKVWCEDNNKKY